MKKLLVLLCLLTCPVMAGDLEDYKAKRVEVLKRINQLQIALVQIDAVIGYLETTERNNGKQ